MLLFCFFLFEYMLVKKALVVAKKIFFQL